MDDLDYCISYLKNANKITSEFDLPKEKTLRALMNITMPDDFSDEYYAAQDRVLQRILLKKRIVSADEFPVFKNGVSLYQGDITCIKSDAIVNAANEKMLGCLAPLHSCIDNSIHSYAGLQMRRDLSMIMKKQGSYEPSGRVKVTVGYNLPAKFVFHTVGPVVSGLPTTKHEILLRSCYNSCLEKSREMKLKTLVFCSVATGVYGYPIEKASRVACYAVKDYLERNKGLHVVFDVFSDEDHAVYKKAIEEIF